jgi:hypothetical protein
MFRAVIASRPPAVHDAARDHRQAVALLALCAVLWSSAGVLIKLVDWNAGAIYARAIRRATAIEATLVSVIEPIFSPVWSRSRSASAPGREPCSATRSLSVR